MFTLSFNYSGGCLGEELIGRDPSQVMIEQPDGTLCPCSEADFAALAGRDTSSTLNDRTRAAPEGGVMDGLFNAFDTQDPLSGFTQVASAGNVMSDGVEADDIPLPHERPEAPETRSGETWDNITNRRIATLHPKVQPHAFKFINEVEQELGITLRVTDGYRSIQEQDELYKKGRTASGKITTFARGGESYHNFGLAIDVAEMEDGQPIWINISKEIAAIGVRNGFEWGGHWRKVDYPHFQMTFGLSTEQLRRGQKP